MEKINLVNAMNHSRQSTKSEMMLYELIELMKGFKKTQIFFGNLHFDSESQQSAIGFVEIEPYINAAYHLMSHGAFDYIIKESDNKKHRQLIFSKKCGDAAYAIYMFVIMGKRLGTDIKEQYLSTDLAGKTYEELSFIEARYFRSCRITMHEFYCYDKYVTDAEISLLKEYIDKY